MKLHTQGPPYAELRVVKRSALQAPLLASLSLQAFFLPCSLPSTNRSLLHHHHSYCSPTANLVVQVV